MITTLVLCTSAIAADPTPDLSTYEAIKAVTGRDAGAHVALALWCEAHGLTAERVKHLALAVLTDPGNPTARGLMGLVDYRGRWERPEDVSAKVKADEALTAKLAEYNARRAKTDDTAEAQWKLALWCEQNGLVAEARAHLAAVTRLDPTRETAWKHLGFKRQGGRWVTEARLATEREDAEAQRKADRYWKPLLTRWRGGLRETARRAEAEQALQGVADPRAVPAVWAVFGAGDAGQQEVAVRVLGGIDAPGASRALAALAVFGRSAEVRRAAVETLKRRDGRDFIGLLVGLVRDPIRYEVRPVNGPGTPGVLFVEGERYDVRRIYDASIAWRVLELAPPRLFAPSVPFDPFGAPNLAMAFGFSGAVLPAGSAAPAFTANPPSAPAALSRPHAAVARAPQAPVSSAGVIDLNAVAAQRDLQIAQVMINAQQTVALSQQQLANDVSAIEAANADARRVNGQAVPALNEVTGQDLGESAGAWQAWWADQRGYAYDPSRPSTKPVRTEFVANPVEVQSGHHSCFGAGTAVRTLGGSRPIESIEPGDQVLTQDVRTGRLSYQPVVAVYHNKPTTPLRVTLGGEDVVVTGIHRFWKAGRGWVMARELKPGDTVRTVGGTARVAAVGTDPVQPVFNLEVGDGQSFFVGGLGALVHDNSPVQPVADPFDAPAALAALGRRSD